MSFWDLAFFVLRHGLINKILKTMVFVDKIEDAIELNEYLQLRLWDYVRNENYAFVIIQSLTSNLDTNIRIKIMEDL